MEISTSWVRLLVGVFLLHSCTAHLCPNGLQYWSSETESCVNCSKCNTRAKPIVIRPCQGHVDTVCGVLSDLNIDWSWLAKKDEKKHAHHKTSRPAEAEDYDDYSETQGKKHPHRKAGQLIDLDGYDDYGETQVKKEGKKHPHHKPGQLIDLDEFDDYGRKSKHHGKKGHHDLAEEDFITPYHKGKKHHGHEPEVNHKKHHISSESFTVDEEATHHANMNDEYIKSLKHSKGKEDLEKQWRKWLALSKSKLEHRKEDLIKIVREENAGHDKLLEGPALESDVTIFDDLDDNKEVEELTRRTPAYQEGKPQSKLNLEVFDELVNRGHKRRKEDPKIDSLEWLMKSGEGANRIQAYRKHHKEDAGESGEGSNRIQPNRKHHKDDAGAESFDYKSIVPTHRLFRDEPSTVSEIMDQDYVRSEKKEEKKEHLWDDRSSMEEREPKMEFTAAERIVWDWQAVALTSAVLACLLFFAVVGMYSILQARQWRRMKNNFNTDMEEMSARISLMHPTLGHSAADGSNTNHYLENLLAGNKLGEKKTNIYIQKPTTSS